MQFASLPTQFEQLVLHPKQALLLRYKVLPQVVQLLEAPKQVLQEISQDIQELDPAKYNPFLHAVQVVAVPEQFKQFELHGRHVVPDK